MAEKASEGTPAEQVLKDLRGMTSLAYTVKRSGGAGQGADGVRQGQPDVYVQGGNGGRAG